MTGKCSGTNYEDTVLGVKMMSEAVNCKNLTRIMKSL